MCNFILFHVISNQSLLKFLSNICINEDLKGVFIFGVKSVLYKITILTMLDIVYRYFTHDQSAVVDKLIFVM